MNKPKPKTIALSPVKSGQIESIGHEGNTLAVKFKSGGTYHYHGVSASQFAELQKAESMGSHLHKHIKGVHDYQRINEEKKGEK